MTDRRSADALRRVQQPAWSQVQSLIEKAPSEVLILPTETSRRDVALEALQITTGSFLGAVVGECGGILVDHGWLRILGAGTDSLPGVHEANDLAAGHSSFLEIAWDALGGRFAINGGGLDAPPGEVCYWGPDTLDWQSIGGGHSAFITWALSDGIGDFYESLRWTGWEREIETLAPDQGLSLWPPPFTTEGNDTPRARRTAVPLTELHDVYADFARQLSDSPDGSRFSVKVTE